MAVIIHSADIQDREGAKSVIEQLRFKYSGLKKILADGGYTGQLTEWMLKGFGWTLEIVHKAAGVSGFNVLPQR